MPRSGVLNVTSAHDVFVDNCYTTTSECCHHKTSCYTFDGNELDGNGSEPDVDIEDFKSLMTILSTDHLDLTFTYV